MAFEKKRKSAMSNTNVKIIAVCGGSGSGKTTLVKEILTHLPDSSLIKVDDYYRDVSHLSKEDQKKINFDHPDTLELTLLAKHLKLLKQGNTIKKPIYDFVTRSRPETETLNPNSFIIVDGILSLYLPELVGLYDYSLFLHVDADIRFIRRLRRDTKDRGRDVESVMDQYLTQVRPMYNKFVSPQQELAKRVLDWNEITLSDMPVQAKDIAYSLSKGLI